MGRPRPRAWRRSTSTASWQRPIFDRELGDGLDLDRGLGDLDRELGDGSDRELGDGLESLCASRPRRQTSSWALTWATASTWATTAGVWPPQTRRGIRPHMFLPLDPIEVIMVATIAIVGLIMWRAVTSAR